VTLLPIDTPLYNHPLPEIEKWLISMGCEQDDSELHCWRIEKPDWRAELCLDIEELTVRYHVTDGKDSQKKAQVSPGNQSIYRTFKYSLSRQDIENAVFAGP
jgi:predicted metalloprotease with PDZ domain